MGATSAATALAPARMEPDAPGAAAVAAAAQISALAAQLQGYMSPNGLEATQASGRGAGGGGAAALEVLAPLRVSTPRLSSVSSPEQRPLRQLSDLDCQSAGEPVIAV